jgi:hypothetical protein
MDIKCQLYKISREAQNNPYQPLSTTLQLLVLQLAL